MRARGHGKGGSAAWLMCVVAAARRAARVRTAAALAASAGALRACFAGRVAPALADGPRFAGPPSVSRSGVLIGNYTVATAGVSAAHRLAYLKARDARCAPAPRRPPRARRAGPCCPFEPPPARLTPSLRNIPLYTFS